MAAEMEPGDLGEACGRGRHKTGTGGAQRATGVARVAREERAASGATEAARAAAAVYWEGCLACSQSEEDSEAKPPVGVEASEEDLEKAGLGQVPFASRLPSPRSSVDRRRR